MIKYARLFSLWLSIALVNMLARFVVSFTGLIKFTGEDVISSLLFSAGLLAYLIFVAKFAAKKRSGNV